MVSKVTNSHASKALQSDFASQIAGAVKDTVANFDQTSKLVMSALEEASKIHPWISGGRLIYKLIAEILILHMGCSGCHSLQDWPADGAKATG